MIIQLVPKDVFTFSFIITGLFKLILYIAGIFILAEVLIDERKD